MRERVYSLEVVYGGVVVGGEGGREGGGGRDGSLFETHSPFATTVGALRPTRFRNLSILKQFYNRTSEMSVWIWENYDKKERTFFWCWLSSPLRLPPPAPLFLSSPWPMPSIPFPLFSLLPFASHLSPSLTLSTLTLLHLPPRFVDPASPSSPLILSSTSSNSIRVIQKA